MSRYRWRPLTKEAQAMLDFIQQHPGCRKKDISLGIDVEPNKLRHMLFNAALRGEVLADSSNGIRQTTYTLGTLLDRTPKEPKKKIRPPKPKTVKKETKEQKTIKAKPKTVKETPKELKTVKPWSPPVKKEVQIIWPIGYKHTYYNCSPL